MNKPNSDEVRRRARRREGARVAITLAPIFLVFWTIRAIEPHHYPVGDQRNEPWFWIVVMVFGLVVFGGLIVGSIRVLRER